MLADAERALDAHRASWSKGDADAIVAGQCLQNDLFLHLAIEAEGNLPRLVALTQRNERVLFRELLERGAQLRDLARVDRAHDALQFWCRKRPGSLPNAWVFTPDAIVNAR